MDIRANSLTVRTGWTDHDVYATSEHFDEVRGSVSLVTLIHTPDKTEKNKPVLLTIRTWWTYNHIDFFIAQ